MVLACFGSDTTLLSIWMKWSGMNAILVVIVGHEAIPCESMLAVKVCG